MFHVKHLQMRDIALSKNLVISIGKGSKAFSFAWIEGKEINERRKPSKEESKKENLTNKLQLEVEKEENFFKKFLFPLFSCSIEVY